MQPLPPAKLVARDELPRRPVADRARPRRTFPPGRSSGSRCSGASRSTRTSPRWIVPRHPVVLRLFRQLDPTGEKRPSDEMAEDGAVGRRAVPDHARRVRSWSTSRSWNSLSPTAGRYALVVATGYQPRPAAARALKREVEIVPAHVVETLSGKPGDGRVVFRSYVQPGGRGRHPRRLDRRDHRGHRRTGRTGRRRCRV